MWPADCIGHCHWRCVPVNMIAKESEFRTISDLENSSGLDRCESHPVEVSGWDVNMRFFVELTNVEENEPGLRPWPYTIASAATP